MSRLEVFFYTYGAITFVVDVVDYVAGWWSRRH